MYFAMVFEEHVVVSISFWHGMVFEIHVLVEHLFGMDFQSSSTTEIE